MRKTIWMRSAIALGVLGLTGACTESFSDFDTSGHGSGGARGDAGPGKVDAGRGAAGSGGESSSAGGSRGGATSAGGSSATDSGAGGVAGSDGGANAGGKSGSGGKASGGTAGKGGGGTSATGGGGGAGGGGAAGAGGCGATQKLCASSCVANDSPSTGCASASCDACALKNVAVDTCSTGACAVDVCAGAYRNCNGQDADGCEVDPTGDSNNCGGCGNRCGLQGGLSCKSSLCGCTADDQCRGGSASSGLTCDTASGLCHCGAATCVHGETCNRNGDCTCNGGRACTSGRTCCQTPGGCVDLTSTPTSCGACGHACPTGFVCSASACNCRVADDCNAGSAGTCNGSGLCVCGATTCAHGERCLPSGKCG